RFVYRPTREGEGEKERSGGGQGSRGQLKATQPPVPLPGPLPHGSGPGNYFLLIRSPAVESIAIVSAFLASLAVPGPDPADAAVWEPSSYRVFTAPEIDIDLEPTRPLTLQEDKLESGFSIGPAGGYLR